MKKLKVKFILLIALMLFLSACMPGAAQSVTFTNITGAGSTDATVAVVYQEEEEYKEKSTDIYIKSSVDNLTLKIKQELNDFVTIVLPEKNQYYSLARLISNAKIEKIKFKVYKEAKSVNYIINSNTDCNLTFKAVVGDLTTNGLELQNEVNISKEFVLKVEKHQK